MKPSKHSQRYPNGKLLFGKQVAAFRHGWDMAQASEEILQYTPMCVSLQLNMSRADVALLVVVVVPALVEFVETNGFVVVVIVVIEVVFVVSPDVTVVLVERTDPGVLVVVFVYVVVFVETVDPGVLALVLAWLVIALCVVLIESVSFAVVAVSVLAVVARVVTVVMLADVYEESLGRDLGYRFSFLLVFA